MCYVWKMQKARGELLSVVLVAAVAVSACQAQRADDERDAGAPAPTGGDQAGPSGGSQAAPAGGDRPAPTGGDDPPPAGGQPASGGSPEACAPAAGRVTLRRLNRDEYDLTLRDLLGDLSQPAREFPADDIGHGFDNQADVLSMSPVLVEKYERAAERAVDVALRLPRTRADRFEFAPEVFTASVGALAGSAWNLWSNGEATVTLRLPEAGRYRVSTALACQLAGPDPCRAALRLDAAEVRLVEVASPPPQPGVFEAEVLTGAGTHTFGVAFLNDYYAPDDPDPTRRDRNLLVGPIVVEGPLDFDPSATNPTRDAVLTCAPAQPQGPEADACADEILGNFAARAWRRTPTPAERARLVALSRVATDDGDTFEAGVRLGMRGVLLSPHFLFKVEGSAPPSDGAPANRPLTGDELATRLSYFLWGSLPDAALQRALAAGGETADATLDAAVDEMLDDPRASAFVERFAGQWLYLRNLANVAPDYVKFPDFDEALRVAMRAETEAYFRAFLDEDRSALDMLDARFTFLNARLARHYGLPLPPSDAPPEALRRVDLEAIDPSAERGGLLSHGSVLTVTSYPTRTSPVKRGKWVLEQLLCTVPPPPPPGVEGLIEQVDPNATFRERLEQHRSEPICAGCHALMDPIGFGLERYDGVGAARTLDVGQPIDDSGVLFGDRPFHGARELAALLKDDLALPECMVEQVFTFAVGRAPTNDDLCALDAIEAEFAARGHRLRALVKAIVKSPAFRARTADTTAPEAP